MSAASLILHRPTDIAATPLLRPAVPSSNGPSSAPESMSRVPVGPGALDAPGTGAPNPYLPVQYQPLRRAPASGRQPEELHIPPASAGMGDYNRYQAPPAYAAGDGLSINVHPSTPQHLGNAASSTLPGALQPGPLARPGPQSSNNAPGSIPTVPHISTQMQQPPVSGRPANPGHSHGHSRSSPTSLEQVKYKAFTNTPEAAKYGPSNPTSIPQTPQTASYSPLGLADIRPRTDAGFSDDPTSPGFYHGGADPLYPTNSNYLAPWPIYATDWCKWPSRSHSSQAGKVAIGSYLEDNHNYVWLVLPGCVGPKTDLMFRSRYSMFREHNPLVTEKWGSSSSRPPRQPIRIPLPGYCGSRLRPRSRRQISWLPRATIYDYGLSSTKPNRCRPTRSIGRPTPKTNPFTSSLHWRCCPIRNRPSIPLLLLPWTGTLCRRASSSRLV